MQTLMILAAVVVVMALLGAGLLFLRLKFLPALLGTLGLWLLLAVGAAALVPALVSLDDFKPQIVAAVKNETGRDLVIGGPIGFSLFPTLGLHLSDVTFSNASWGKAPQMLAVKEATVGVALKPLLNKQVEVQTFRLVRPEIHLESRSNTQANWLFVKGAGEGTAASSAAGSPSAQPGEVKIASFEVVDGTLSYLAAGGKPLELKGVNLSLSLPGLDRPLALTGDAQWQGRKVAVRADVAALRALVAEKASPVTLTVKAGTDTLTFKGEASKTAYTGALNASVDDLPALAGWLSGGKPAALPFHALSLKGQVNGSPTQAKVEGLVLALDDLKLSGKARASWLGKPKVTAEVDVSTLDLDRFSSPEGATSGEGAAAAGKGAPDLSFLSALDADVVARLAGLTTKGVALGATTAKAKLTDGKLAASLTPASLFGGTVAGTLDLTARQFAAHATLDGVDIAPVLTTFAGFSKLSGKGDATVLVTGPVADSATMKRGLNGNGRVMLRDGALKGVNLAALVRNAKATLSGQLQTSSGPEQTDFTELSGTYLIRNGIVSNDDLKMLSPLLRVGGKGTVDLPQSFVNYRVEANLVGDIRGQGGEAGATGLVVPVKVKGPFNNLSYTPDLQGLVVGNLDSAGKIVDEVKNLKGKNLEQAGKNVLGNLLGVPPAPAPAPSPAPAPATQPAASPADAAPAPVAPQPTPAPAPAPQPDPAQQLLKNLLSR